MLANPQRPAQVKEVERFLQYVGAAPPDDFRPEPLVGFETADQEFCTQSTVYRQAKYIAPVSVGQCYSGYDNLGVIDIPQKVGGRPQCGRRPVSDLNLAELAGDDFPARVVGRHHERNGWSCVNGRTSSHLNSRLWPGRQVFPHAWRKPCRFEDVATALWRRSSADCDYTDLPPGSEFTSGREDGSTMPSFFIRK